MSKDDEGEEEEEEKNIKEKSQIERNKIKKRFAARVFNDDGNGHWKTYPTITALMVTNESHL